MCENELCEPNCRLAITGSLVGDRDDAYSDVDLILVIDDEAYDAVMRERLALVGSWASLVAGSPGSMSASHV